MLVVVYFCLTFVYDWMEAFICNVFVIGSFELFVCLLLYAGAFLSDYELCQECLQWAMTSAILN